MKIGILTFHHVLNYGALLQLYALQQKLIELGHNPVVLNITTFQRNRHPLISGYGFHNKQFFSGLKNKPAGLIKHKRFKDFRKKYLKITKPIKSLNEFQNSAQRVEAFIVGSDQVWNEKYGISSINLYTLKDLKDTSTLNISYAASSGKQLSENVVLEAFSFAKFHAISVRDKFTKKLVFECSRLNSQIVVDPTLLINWTDHPIEAKSIKTPEKYIFVYGFSNETIQSALEVKKNLGLPIVGIPMEGECQNDYVDYCILDAGIGEWLNLVSKAEFICTKSFHGMMFSIKFKRPFLVATGASFARERLIDFADYFCLSDRVLKVFNEKKVSEILNLADDFYNELDVNLQDAIIGSERFLTNSLSLKTCLP